MPRTKAYGAVSVLVQLAARKTGFHAVPPTVFRPRPRVESALVAFERVEGPALATVRPVVEAAFAHRRKTLANSVGALGPSRRERRPRPRSPRSTARRRSGPKSSGRRSSSRSPRRSERRRVKAYAKLNLALVVGPLRADGKHEVATVLQAIDLHDDVDLEPASALSIQGFPDDTLVRSALEALGAAAGVEPHWRAVIEKRIPVAAGLGGGSSDAAAALRLANALLPEPLPETDLHDLAAGIGADVPFFLAGGPQLGTGDGTVLEPLELPGGYVVVLVLPEGESKESTASVYARVRRAARRRRIRGARSDAPRGARDASAARPTLHGSRRNDLVSSPLAAELARLGAFRADVTGAGPAVYGLFEQEQRAREAADALSRAGRVFVTRPVGDA